MTKSFAYINEKIVSEIPQGDIQSFLKDANLLWVDIEDPDEKDIDILEDIFMFHELSIEDCIFPNNQPKIDEYDDYLFIVIHCLIDSEIEGLNIFLGKNFIVTVHEREIQTLLDVINKTKKDVELFKNGACFLLHSILDNTIDSFLLLIDKLDIEIDKREEEAVEAPTQETINKLFDLKKRIISLRRTILPQQAVINTLIRKQFDFIKEETIPYFKDINDHIIRINSTLEIYRDSTTNILQLCFSNFSTQLAQIVKILTVITTFILPLTLITSYYGMNVAIPEFKWGILGWLFSIVIMVGIVLAMFIYFRRKKWL